MKYIVVMPDGIGDHPAEALGGKTPLEVARIPNLNFFAKIGKVGTVRTVPDKSELSSHIAFATLLGYEPKQFSLGGPGPLEAANLELKLEDNEVAFRMNFVTEADGILADTAAGQITTREAKALISYLNKKLASEFVRFFAGSGHRHIAVVKDSNGLAALSAECVEPDDVNGKRIEDHLPKGAGQDLIKKLMYDAKLLLENHEINQVRVDLGENPANMIWLWGQGCMPKLPKFSERFAVGGASISTQGVIQGLSRLVGLTVVDQKSVHAFPDFDYEGDADQLMELISEKDFVLLHVRACHEAAREGNIKQKVLSLEAIDHHVIGAVKSFYENQKDVRILISPLLNLPTDTRMYARDSVPFIMAGKNIMADEIERFTEATAQLSSLRIKEGWKLMEQFIAGKDLA